MNSYFDLSEEQQRLALTQTAYPEPRKIHIRYHSAFPAPLFAEAIGLENVCLPETFVKVLK